MNSDQTIRPLRPSCALTSLGLSVISTAAVSMAVGLLLLAAPACQSEPTGVPPGDPVTTRVSSDPAPFFEVWEEDNVFGVLENSPIKSIKDLKGKVLAINAKGGAVDMAARTIMLQNGLKPGKDVTIVEARFGAMEPMLRQGKVDVATLIAPFWARANAKGGVRPLFLQKDALGDTQFLFYVAQRKFVEKNRAAVVDWLEDYVRGTRWLLDPKNRDRALDMTAKLTKRKKRIYASWALLKDKDLHHDPNARLDLAALQRNVDTLHKLGILRRSFDVTTQIDESLVKEAAARIK